MVGTLQSEMGRLIPTGQGKKGTQLTKIECFQCLEAKKKKKNQLRVLY